MPSKKMTKKESVSSQDEDMDMESYDSEEID